MLTHTITVNQILATECTRCGVGAGENCTDTRSGRERRAFHLARIDLCTARVNGTDCQPVAETDRWSAMFDQATATPAVWPSP